MSGVEALAREVERIATDSGAVVGFGFLHLESGRRLILNRGQRFPMASTYKIAMAAGLLALVDEGASALDRMVGIDQDELSPGGGIVKAHIYHPGLSLSVHNLINLAMTVSDNTSADKMLELAGGPAAVTDFLRTAGIEGMRVDRSTKLLITDAYGVTDRMPQGQWSYPFLQEHEESVFEQAPPDASADAHLTDPRDTTTPEAMVRLLERLFRGELLGAAGTRVLLEIMERCETGEQRLRGLLPPGVAVTHKTGTIPRVCINDAGILSLPDGGHAVVAVFVKAVSAADYIGEAASERVIAQIARSAYDFCVFGC